MYAFLSHHFPKGENLGLGLWFSIAELKSNVRVGAVFIRQHSFLLYGCCLEHGSAAHQTPKTVTKQW